VNGLHGDRPAAPSVWLVLSDKLGDSAQVRAIASALPWPCEERRIVVREPYILGKPGVRASLRHVDRERSDPIEPPWPDLVITIGRRMLMVAMWIRDQSRGRTKVVLVGRPRRCLGQLDLVIASKQYRLPRRDNVLHHTYPLMRVDEPAIAAAAAQWRSVFESLPRPLTALMVGGQTKSLCFDAAVAVDLAKATGDLVASAGGSLAVATSRRTPKDVVEALAVTLPSGAILHRWGADAGSNPYQALLGLADRFIVTGDSASMLVEIARLGKPLAIYPLPPSSWRSSQPLRRLGHRLHPMNEAGGGPRILRIIGDALYRIGILGYTRDLTALHDQLISDGLAVRFGDPFRPGGSRPPEELPGIVRRIRALVDDAGSPDRIESS
jgi:uncharacterized protein